MLKINMAEINANTLMKFEFASTIAEAKQRVAIKAKCGDNLSNYGLFYNGELKDDHLTLDELGLEDKVRPPLPTALPPFPPSIAPPPFFLPHCGR
jgi:hypothetical protein